MKKILSFAQITKKISQFKTWLIFYPRNKITIPSLVGVYLTFNTQTSFENTEIFQIFLKNIRVFKIFEKYWGILQKYLFF